MPSRCSTSATSRCSGSSCGLLPCCARSIAVATASRAFSVYLLILNAIAVLVATNARKPILLFRVSCFRGLSWLFLSRFQFLQRFEMFSLLGRQVSWQLNVDRRIKIAELVRLTDRRHAVALQPEHLAALRRRRN